MVAAEVQFLPVEDVEAIRKDTASKAVAKLVTTVMTDLKSKAARSVLSLTHCTHPSNLWAHR
jgi:hypothetical protein